MADLCCKDEAPFSSDYAMRHSSIVQTMAAVLVCTMAIPQAPGAEPSSTGKVFRVSVDQGMWAKWGFQYPVTYIFDLAGLSLAAQVSRRDLTSEEWKPLEQKTTNDFFNGIECIRFNYSHGRAFVSAGFTSSHCLELRFQNITSARFAGIARYYDDRSSAYTLSLDNWGRLATANPGAPWRGPADDQSDNRLCHVGWRSAILRCGWTQPQGL